MHRHDVGRTYGFSRHAREAIQTPQRPLMTVGVNEEQDEGHLPDPLEPYRLAIQRRGPNLCWDHEFGQLTPDREPVVCRISRFLPELVAVAQDVASSDAPSFEANVERAICTGRCGNLDGSGFCPVRARAGCCLYRNLPLVYDALEHAIVDRPSLVAELHETSRGAT
jgi:hypothetical protein